MAGVLLFVSYLGVWAWSSVYRVRVWLLGFGLSAADLLCISSSGGGAGRAGRVRGAVCAQTRRLVRREFRDEDRRVPGDVLHFGTGVGAVSVSVLGAVRSRGEAGENGSVTAAKLAKAPRPTHRQRKC